MSSNPAMPATSVTPPILARRLFLADLNHIGKNNNKTNSPMNLIPTLWLSALNSYPKAIEKRASVKKTEESKLKLINNDKWLNEFSNKLCSQSNSTVTNNNSDSNQKFKLTRPILLRIVEWKLSKGTFRPGMLQQVESNSESEITEVWNKVEEDLKNIQVNLNGSDSGTQQALVTVNTLRPPLISLTKTLKGVGPATGSAVLATVYPNLYSFMSDEAMTVILSVPTQSQCLPESQAIREVKLKYDVKTYVDQVNERIRQKGIELRKYGGNSLSTFSANDVQKALFSVYVLGEEALQVQINQDIAALLKDAENLNTSLSNSDSKGSSGKKEKVLPNKKNIISDSKSPSKTSMIVSMKKRQSTSNSAAAKSIVKKSSNSKKK